MVQFRDPVHGDIVFTGVIEELIFTDEFQRLGEVQQLGTTDKVYPGATHTRFAHSLGACFLAGELAHKFQVTPQDRQLLQIAALLHDIGHYDFSHALEHLAPYDHEENGKRIILGTIDLPNRTRGNIAKILTAHAISPQTIVDLLQKQGTFPSFYYSILSGAVIDCDRMDYLKRDKYYTGAMIGEIDISRLLSVLVIHPETKEIGVLQKGVASLEQFLIARTHMYRQVYFHPQTDIGETMLFKAAAASKDLASPLLYGDQYLLARLAEHGTPLTKKLLARIRAGKRQYYDTALLIDTMGSLKHLAKNVPQDKEAFEKRLLHATGLADGDILVSFPGAHRRASTLPKFPVLLTEGTWDDLFAISSIARAAMAENVSTTALAVYAEPEHVVLVREAAIKLLS